MKRLLWLTLLPIGVVLAPWASALLTHGRRQAAVLGALWLLCLLLTLFVAFGPGLIGLFILAVVQLARTPWHPPEPMPAASAAAALHTPPESAAT